LKEGIEVRRQSQVVEFPHLGEGGATHVATRSIGANDMQVRNVKRDARDEDAHGQHEYDQPDHVRENQPASMLARIRLVRPLMTHSGWCLCMLQIHRGAPCLAFLKPCQWLVRFYCTQRVIGCIG
jgi:hypothetical protein